MIEREIEELKQKVARIEATLAGTSIDARDGSPWPGRRSPRLARLRGAAVPAAFCAGAVLAISSAVVAEPIPNLDPETDFTGVISGEKMHANFANIEDRLAAAKQSRAGEPVLGTAVASWINYATASTDPDSVIDELEVELETTGRSVRVWMVGSGAQPSLNAGASGTAVDFTFRLERRTAGVDVEWVTVEEFYWRSDSTAFFVPPSTMTAMDTPPPGTTTYRMLGWPEPNGASPAVGGERVRLVAQELAATAPR
jgi:hypothetical protein